MRKLSSFLLLILGLSTIEGHAQQDPQYTQYMYNMNIVNPAYAGSRGTLSIGVLGRLQWVGIEGAPKTATMAIHAPLGKNLGGGFSAILDRHGPVKETNVYADVSYTISTSEEGRLAFGLKGGVTFFDVGLLSLILPQTAPGVDPLFDDNVNETLPNFGAGVYYYTDKFYIGLSAPNLLETKHLEKDNGTISKASEKMHYFGTLGYVFDLSETLKMKPSVMAKVVSGSPLSLDGNLNFLFNDRLELGVGYRFGDAVTGLVNFGVTRDLRIGYAYDYTTTNLGNYNSGTHEVFLQWDIDFSKKNLKSPRFF
ncbi:type IX secretion system membrane protein PorP/SprF [Aureibaculum sp. 2210JD6-5]|uniref:PorP/SprF family type IX secretion system membrane protein n=1 Tax=Aureibaculum sp. 2210JD6-5 TaxID=3103957 RepID=UPI002AAED6F9|nr:type IX secretion system membrane protein PorP/SprF [Aureibaculum sp. 2210JD6-5]MDY7395985.1 type IX secretion system membrane protein PorP/SprF [Aureibaculum sp. 2210JD6-5]